MSPSPTQGVAPNPQPAITGVPVSGPTPEPYIAPATAAARLQTRYGLAATLKIGHMLTASMRLDQEGPFYGVKFVVEQDREWPRTFKYGWPNLIAAPSPIIVSRQFPGAWLLDYEGVVPAQVVDWVCLEAWRITHLPFDRVPVRESISGGASVEYAPPAGKGYIRSELDEMQSALISPFQMREAHTSPFPSSWIR